MKYITLLALLCCFCTGTSFAQKPGVLSAVPCCDIIGINAAKNIITSRSSTTGKVQQFKTSAAGLKNLRMGDKLSVQNGKITSVNETGYEPINGIVSGNQTGYEPINGIVSGNQTGWEPINEIVSLQVNDAIPCCGIVTVKNLTTGELSSFQTTPGIGHTLTLGQRVSMQNGYAMVQSGASATAAQKGLYAFKTGLDSAKTKIKETGGVVTPVRWEVKPSADLKGTFGQIVIQFPGMTSSGNNFVAVFEVGGKDRLTGATYGNKNFPLLDGEYDVEINSVRVSHVPVKRGMDTRIHIGTISFDVPSSTSVQVYDLTEKTRLCLSYGSMMCGVPSGEYYIKVGGSRKKVSLADGQVIKF